MFLFIYMTTASMRSGPVNPISGSSLRGHGCPTVWCQSRPDEIHFGIVADLDQMSKVDDAKKPTWRSWFKKGTLRHDSARDLWSIDWSPDIELRTQLNEAGRGLELSELVAWEGKLLTFDDRTGVAFELDATHKVIPRYILMEGNGATSKGQKTEWATVKDGLLYVGSFGKPYTTPDGSRITSTNNLWIKVVSPSGEIKHMDWTRQYEKMQQVTKSEWPGYMIHEAIHWDDINRLWWVLPRRVSAEQFDEKLDEVRGSNLALAFNEDFTELERKMEIGQRVPTHGWSSFKFVPWTNNRVILGLRTMENENKATGKAVQETYITLFDTNGEVFLPEQRIPGNYKFEGLEFL